MGIQYIKAILNHTKISIVAIFLYALCTTPTSLPAQSKTLKFNHLTINEGLSQSSVFSILEDAEGFMWFGTRAGGLNKYDGYSFTVFNHNDNDSLSISGNEILCLLDDYDGNIWAGTRGNGLNKYDKTKNIFYNYYHNTLDSTTIPNNDINRLFKDKYNTIWIATNGGLCYLNKKQNNFIRIHFYGPDENNVKSIAQSSIDSLIWLGSKNGLFLFDIKNKKTIKHFQHQPNNRNSLSSTNVTSIAVDSIGRVWVGTYKHGLNLLDNTKKDIFKRFAHNPQNNNSITSNVIRTLHIDKKGIVWIGTKIALEQLMPDQQNIDNPKFIHHKKDETDDRSMNQNSVFSFYEDSHNNFWIGTYNGGLNYLYTGTQKFEYFKHQIYSPNSLSNNVVSCFAITSEGLWIGTEGGGLNLLNRTTGTFKHYKQDFSHTDSLQSNHIKSLHVDNENNLWIGTYNGLFLYKKEQNKFIQYLKGSNIYSISDGVNNELWLGTSTQLVVFNKQNKSFKTYVSIEQDISSLSSNKINKVFKDKNEGLWIGTKIGLNYYNRENDSFIQFLHDRNDKSSISNSHITGICEDTNGDLWFATYDGLNKLNRGDSSFTHYGEEINILGKVINNIQFDNIGYCWITTNNTLSRFHINNNVSNPDTSFSFRSYDSGDGLQNGEFRLNGSYKSANGEMFFGGVNGFNIFQPNKVKNNTSIPKVLVTNFKLFNKAVHTNDPDSPLKKQVWQTKELILNHKQSIFTFEFVSLNYLSPENNEYAYRMKGLEKDWNYIGNKREATYTSLPAGKYTFQVKASNNDGIWNNEGTSIQITILPPWWKTWWFKIVLGFAIVIFITSYSFYRIRNLEKQKQLLEQTVISRTNDLQESNSQLEESHEEISCQKEAISEHNDELKAQNNKIEKAYENIEMLSQIGRKITMSLAIEQIVHTIYSSLQTVMDVPIFAIGLFNESEQRIDFRGVVASGEILPNYHYNLNDKKRMSVWCFNNQKEILINDLSTEYKDYLNEIDIPKQGILPNSLIYLPLNVKEKRIGVITVHSPNKQTYTNYHLNIIKNIGIYAAIALDNAEAYDKIEKQNDELIISESKTHQLNEELTVINEQLSTEKEKQKQTIGMLKKTQSQLLHSEKMASIGVLASGVAHEINNPLNFIKGGNGILKMYIHDNLPDHSEALGKYIEAIETGVTRATNIVNGLNRFSRDTSNYAETCDIHSIIDNCLLMVNNQLEFRIVVEKEYTPSIFIFKGNEGELHQLFINILTNAIQAIKDEGLIKISSKLTENYLSIEISDTGEGIPEENIKKITEPFFTTKEPGEGTGLGMSISYTIVQKHNAEIHFTSELNKGTTVAVTFPIELKS